MFLLVAFVSAQFYPGYPYYNGPYYGLQHFFAPINSPLNSPSSAPFVVIDKVNPEETKSEVDSAVKATTPSCDCNVVIGVPSGCKIVKAAPKGYSCKCQLGTLGLSCSGKAEKCVEPNDPNCLSPDTSIKSCLYNANGNCNGYSAPSGCSCKYRSFGPTSGGCYVASPAPAYYACRCIFHGFTTCSGITVPNYKHCGGKFYRLKDCLNPGTTRADCNAGNVGDAVSDCGGTTWP